MTSPTWETFCCNVTSNYSLEERVHFNQSIFSIISIVSASFGVFGALYQIFPIHEEVNVRSALSGQRQRHIIRWLASADLFACIGIIIRSVLWLYSDRKYILSTTEVDIFCAFISGWILYFYTTTYMWTMCYAIDVYWTIKENVWKLKYYHLISWGLPFVTVSVGLYILYVPNLQCHDNWKHVLIHYIFTFVSLLAPMIINPILYSLSSKQVRLVIQSHLGRYTDQERILIHALQKKFLNIVIVFYVCWLPNLLNDVIMWLCWYNLPNKVLIGLWYFMAIVNPLQAVLNSVVYKGWQNCFDLPNMFYNMFRSKVVIGIIPEQSFTTDRCEIGNDRELLVPTH